MTHQKHKTDGRIVVVGLTRKGEELRPLFDFHERINAMLFADLPPEEQGLAFSLLSKMQRNAESAPEGDRPPL
ncbi:MAG: DNA-binding MarR family transcriptional regulator [Paracoccaceae bacterium]